LEFILDEKLLKNFAVEPLLREAKEVTAIFFASMKIARANRKSVMITAIYV
jgi:hypothetical protein